MPTKRDRRRHQRVQRERQREKAEERREQSERRRAAGEAFGIAIKELAALAAEPERFVSGLAELLSDPKVGVVFRQTATAYTGGTAVAREAGAEMATALADRLIAGESTTGESTAGESTAGESTAGGSTAGGSTAGDLVAAARAGGGSAGDDGEPTALRAAEATRWWSIGLYSEAGETEKAERLASSAAEARGVPAKDDPELAWLLGRLRLKVGRPAAAAKLALEVHDIDPDDPDVAELLAESLEQLHRSPEPGPEGEAILALFADRSRLYGLRRAVDSFFERNPDFASWAEGARREWEETFLEVVGADEWDRIAGQHPFAAEDQRGATAQELLAEESTWSRGPEPAETDADESGAQGGPQHDDNNGSLLNRVAADPATSPDLADLARDWQARARWGLWQLGNPSSSPGVWVTDLVTRRLMYVSMPRDHLAELPRWSVLAGCFFPDRGVWRSGSAFAVLDPLEGDRAAEIALTLGTNFLGNLAEQHQFKAAKQMRERTPRLDDVPPHGVAAAYGDTMNAQLSGLHSKVISVTLPQLLGSAWASRQHGPSLMNTDQEPIELFEATAQVPDPEGLRAALARRPEFETETKPAEGAASIRFAWLGREMTAMEAETSWAEFQAMAAQRGLGPVERPAGERRWIRGSLRLDGDLLTVEVNSRPRLERLTVLLSKLGIAEPVVERHVDPRLDTALPVGWRPIAEAGSPESEMAWRSRWLDEELPALGTTPREAAHRAETAARLETLLRLFEWEADLARLAGKRPLDVSLVREALADEEGQSFHL